VSQDTLCPKTIHLPLALGLRPERLEVGVFSADFDKIFLFHILPSSGFTIIQMLK